jgi:hypothetical protein
MQVLYPRCAGFKNVPGRKTDVNDAMRIADLLAHGLIRSSFVPSPPRCSPPPTSCSATALPTKTSAQPISINATAGVQSIA